MTERDTEITRTTLGAQVAEGGYLHQQLLQFEESGDFQNRSEAVRAALQRGLSARNGGLEEHLSDEELGLLVDAVQHAEEDAVVTDAQVRLHDLQAKLIRVRGNTTDAFE